ncbi:MAG: lamin tail domain-containing protein [Myxococcales bacterium]
MFAQSTFVGSRSWLVAAFLLAGTLLSACPGPAPVDSPDAHSARADAQVTASDASAVDPVDGAVIAHDDASQPAPDAGGTVDGSALVPDGSSSETDASTLPDATIVLLPDSGTPTGTIQFSPSSAQQGADLQVNAVTSLTLDAADFTVAIDFASGAAIFNATVTGTHHFTFDLSVASDAPVGLWTVTAQSGGEQAAGQFEIVEKPVVTKSIEFVPALIPRGQTTPVTLKAQGILLYSTLEVSFPPESLIQVQGLTVDASGAQATMNLQVDGAAPLGQAIATVSNGAQEYHPKVTVAEGTSGALRFDEVLPHASSLAAGYVELMNVGGAPVDTSSWKIVVDGGATVLLPAKTIAPGERLLLASGSGVPGGATVVNGLGFPMDSGRLLLQDASGAQLDSVRWNLADAACAARVGIAMERVDPGVSGEVAANWLPSQALVRSAMTPPEWSSDRGSPGLASFVSVTGQPLVLGTPAAHALGSRSTLVHHSLTVARGSWIAMIADIDRVAGFASTAMFAVDPATGAAFTPSYVTASFGDSVAMLEVPSGAGTASLDLRVWADPVEALHAQPVRRAGRTAERSDCAAEEPEPAPRGDQHPGRERDLRRREGRLHGALAPGRPRQAAVPVRRPGHRHREHRRRGHRGQERLDDRDRHPGSARWSALRPDPGAGRRRLRQRRHLRGGHRRDRRRHRAGRDHAGGPRRLLHQRLQAELPRRELLDRGPRLRRPSGDGHQLPGHGDARGQLRSHPLRGPRLHLGLHQQLRRRHRLQLGWPARDHQLHRRGKHQRLHRRRQQDLRGREQGQLHPRRRHPVMAGGGSVGASKAYRPSVVTTSAPDLRQPSASSATLLPPVVVMASVTIVTR